MASKRKEMSRLYMRAYNVDLAGSQPVSETASEAIRLGRDGRYYKLEKDSEGRVTAEYRQLTRREAEHFGFSEDNDGR